ncbi:MULTISPECIES: hypothetical protein [Hymenobacter]|uniref:Uncharacterized protein n=1 Tax=Hymenobacter yonginensis TaxID=748197 RepID=A0ABY7PQS2_9BACT|nr:MULTISPECIES: hypothetical protein [Hymenobacter]AII51531.1 hypothetical protein N008_05985 [Hymenobacter sp. APR13]WBO84570.1 hypothetical protein O9Z63_19665 [Hymenobacter yonginensis]
MKSLLRFFLLFALIIIGKFAKEPAGFSDLTKAMQAMEGAPISPVLLLQKPNVQTGSPAGEFELWQPTSSTANAATSFQ